MAILSANSIIRSIACLHLIVGYYLLTDPPVVATHNIVTVLSFAIGLPAPDPGLPSDAVSKTTPISALLAVVIVLFAISDLSATSMNPALSLLYYSSQTPVRLFFFFVLTAWSYSYRPGGLFASRAVSAALAAEQGGLKKGLGPLAKGIGSGLVFSWAFMSVIGWFWVFITLRDERREAAAREARRKAE